MTKIISIDGIDVLVATISPPLYVLVAGGMAVGKTHVVTRHIKDVDIFDIDDTMAEMGFVEYRKEQFSTAMSVIGHQIEEHMNDKKSMVAMGTASILSTAINRLHEAKMQGYLTVLLYIDASVKQSMEQNIERTKQGGREITKTNEYKIERTNIGAANTVANLRETLLVDYFVHYDNKRNGG